MREILTSGSVGGASGNRRIYPEADGRGASVMKRIVKPRPPLNLSIMCGEKMNKDCVICQIIASTIPARIVCRDENAIAFFPREMNARGHVVVAPIRHCADIFDIRNDVLNSVMCMAQFLADHCARQLGADGINLLHASGEAAQQSVPHFHVHILPRFRDDDLDAWPDLPEWQGDPDELLGQMKVPEEST
ncbi:HIT family protein [Desulfobacterales bacterium HSG2]|nr:HIT family protein [Desulfobacterales bacterium HSG2]